MFGLSFLSPLFLAGIAAAAIPIAIHLFHRRAEPLIEFSAMRFLRRAPVEHSHRRRVRELILLALRVSAVVLLALAFARPYLAESAAALAAPSMIVLVDTSVSMTAAGQFERAKGQAAAIVRAAAVGSRVGVVTFANGADVVAPLGDDRAAALTAIAQLKPGGGATRYRAALTRAAELLGERGGRVVMITDLQQSGWDTTDQGVVPAGVAVEIEEVAGPPSNLAVTSLRVEGRDAFASVQNFSERQAATQVSFTVDGRPASAAAVTVDAGGTRDAHVTLPPGASGALAATVVDTHGFAADNVRYALLDDTAASLILAVTASGHPSESLYLQRAVAVAEGLDGFRFRAVGGPVFSSMTPEELGDVHVIAMLGTRGLEQRGRELLAGYVRSGGGLLLTAGPDVDPVIVRQALQNVVQTAWIAAGPKQSPVRFAPDDGRHPIFRVFGGVGTLGNVSFGQVAEVDPGPEAVVVARFTDGRPAMVEEAAGEGRVLLFASDLNNVWNDFPLQPAFVPFLHETFRHLASARPRPRDYLVGELATAAGRNAGVASVNGRRIVVNTDPRESDPARMTADAFKAGVAELTARGDRQNGVAAQQREDGQRLWQYALLLMVVSLAAEGMLGRRLG